MRWWRKLRRRYAADRLGWQWAGRVISRSAERPYNQRRVDQAIRNANRLYRLIHGHGNPWKPYKGV